MSGNQHETVRLRDNTPSFSFALVSRFQYCETPFLNEFINYYVELGIDHFYFVNTEPDNLERIESHVAPEYSARMTIINKEPSIRVRGCQNLLLPHVKESFTLHVDLDEFLYLDGKNLRTFLADYLDPDNRPTHGAFTFPWVMSPCYKYVHRKSIRDILSDDYLFPSREVKSMALTAVTKEIGEHRFTYGEQVVERNLDVNDDNVFIFHVSSRGIFDIINKVQYGRLRSAKESLNPVEELDDLLFDPKSRRLPNRFVALAFQSRFRKHTLSLSYRFPELRHVTNTQLLEDITLSGLKGLLGKDVSKQDTLGVISKIRKFRVPRYLVDQYASKRINILDAIKAINSGSPSWLEGKFRALKALVSDRP